MRFKQQKYLLEIFYTKTYLLQGKAYLRTALFWVISHSIVLIYFAAEA
jgi:hypothetical protein